MTAAESQPIRKKRHFFFVKYIYFTFFFRENHQDDYYSKLIMRSQHFFLFFLNHIRSRNDLIQDIFFPFKIVVEIIPKEWTLIFIHYDY